MLIRRNRNKTYHFGSGFVCSLIAVLFLAGIHDSHAGEAIISCNIANCQSEPVIDGEIAEGEWASAEHVFLEYETFPSQNIPALVETEVLIMEDGKNFYLAFIASDPEPGKIRAFYRNRDLL